jgi:penicillin-binding protein 1B
VAVTPPALDAAERRLAQAQGAVERLVGRWQAPRLQTRVPAELAPTRRRWLAGPAGWLATTAAGMATGLAIALARGFSHARADVAVYLADPPHTLATVVWSAPMEVRVGLPLHLDALAADLLATGLDRVAPGGSLEPGQFAADADSLELWTEDVETIDGTLTGLRARITVLDGKVARIEPTGGLPHPGFPLVLPPTVLGTVGDPDIHRDPVRLAQLSPWLSAALISMEDERFRSHFGVDVVGIGRALVGNAAREELQGGSTLTQQLAKNLFLTPERTVRRKVHEILYAAALEGALDKDQILELYLSDIYLGQMGALPLRGVESAARGWFGRSAAALDVVQAATVVGVIPAPNAWSPVRNPTGALERRNLVLRKMGEDGLLTADELADALARPLGIDGLEPSKIRRAPYAVDVALSEAEQILGPPPFDGGLSLHTGIQPLLQRAAEDAVATGLAELTAEHPEIVNPQAALVAVRLTDGEVVAMVGGRSYAESPFNRASEAHRQVGSTVKPFTLLAAVEHRVAGPNTVLEDAPISRTFGDERWTPQNYDGQFLGPITVRKVIEKSRNIPSILLAERVGATRLQETLRAVGFAEATRRPSTALGAFAATPLEMAGAWTVFDHGVAQRPRVLLAVADGHGDLLGGIPPEATRVASPAAAAVAAKVLEGVLRGGTGSKSSQYGVGPPAAGKSGTTDEFRDAWFVGLTKEYAVAVWVGQDEGLLGVAGSAATLPTWARFVAATAGSKAPRERPDGVVQAEICTDTGLRAVETCQHRTWDWVLRSMVPGECAGEHELPVEETEEPPELQQLTRWLAPRGHEGELRSQVR